MASELKASTSAREDARVGTLLAERYRIDALIGEGGMGRVYSAEHVLMKKRLAVKVLRRELTTVPEVVARFEREALAAASIEHPNVASATDFGKLPDGSVFLVLEYVQGRSLRDEIAEGPMRLERALHIARQIAAGLSVAHAQGIVHRDLKPENVMLVERGGDTDFVKVLDFGIAKVPVSVQPSSAPTDQPITRAGMVFGTPEYMAPEQALGQTVDGRADLYSLGVILFEMLAGMRPFSSLSAVGILGQQLGTLPPTVGSKLPQALVPQQVEEIVARLLNRERDSRYPDAAAAALAIDDLLVPAPGRAKYRYALVEGLVPKSEASAPVREFDVLLDEPATALLTPVQPLTADLASATRDDKRPGLRTSLRAAIASVFPPDAALREKLPQRLRDSLRPVPARALFVAVALIGVLVTALLIVVAVAIARRVGEPEAVPTAKSPPLAPSAVALPGAVALPSALAPSSSPAELASARSEGASALETLSARYPLDSRPLLALAEAQVESDPAKATSTLTRALALDGKVAQEPAAAALLSRAAQQRTSSETAFALLEGPMGGAGADVLWDLAASEQVSMPVRSRAGRWLRSPDFRRVASKSLLLAADLRTAKSCEAAHALLADAAQLADSRSLPQLLAWQSTQGCGKQKRQDCMPCLRQDTALEQAITKAKLSR